MSDEEPEAQDTDITDDELLPDDEPAPPPQDNAGSGRELRRKRTRSRAELKESEEFWQRVFADPVGRREGWRLLQAGHCFEERFACGPNGFPQTEATWFHAGEQAFVMRLYQTLMLRDRAGVFVMHDEHDARFSRAGRPPRQRSEVSNG
jgi:hypothetical protein